MSGGSFKLWLRSGRVRVLAVNALGVLVVLVGAELLARWGFADGRSHERPSVVSATSLRAGVVPLLPSSRVVPPPSAKLARPPSSAWRETIDAAGLTVRTIGALYAGPRDQKHWLIPGARVRVSKLHAGEAIYDVIQTISAQGFRVTPAEPVRVREVEGSVLFFGCSYTFGEGVEDDETLPAELQRLSGGRLRTYNFGIPGAGAHEMLTILEEERERSSLGNERPVLAVYTALGDHPQRAVGEAGSWQRGRPRYELQAGVATRAGFFGDALHPMDESAQPQASSDAGCPSALLCRLSRGLQARAGASSSASLALWRGLVRRSRDILRERYGIPLVTLVWANGSGDAPALESELVAEGLPVASTRTLIAVGDPDFRLPFDEHPNPQAHVRVAAALLDRLADGSLLDRLADGSLLDRLADGSLPTAVDGTPRSQR
jgi:hypothetical protein